MKLGRSVRFLLTVSGASLGSVFALTLARRRADHWGASLAERSRPMPGDWLVPSPHYETTRAITIRASQANVFAWLIQIGQNRGGFYTFDRLENLIGLNIHSADRILPELQHIAVGDIVPLSALGGPTVVEMNRDQSFVLWFRMDPLSGRPLADETHVSGRRFEWTWAFELRPRSGGCSRLIVRTRANYSPPRLIAPFVATLVEPMHFVMEREMLRGIKRRAELEPPLPTRLMPAA